MDQHTRDAVIASLEQTFAEASGASAAAVYALFSKVEVWLQEMLLPMLARAKSRGALIELLDSIPDEHVPYVLLMTQVVSAVPALARVEVAKVIQSMAHEHPPVKAGRPQAIEEETKPEVIEFVLKLIRQGASVTHAQVRAAQHFQATHRSVQRVWRNRKLYVSTKPKSLAEVFAMLNTA